MCVFTVTLMVMVAVATVAVMTVSYFGDYVTVRHVGK
jgi:hypothetical protein